MTVSLGRVGVPTASGGDGIVLIDPYEVAFQGRQVTISGYWRGTDAATTVWVRDQIEGLDPSLSLDELTVPFVFSDTNHNGFYTVTSASTTVPRGSLGAGGLFHFDWQITATRAMNYRRPRIETPFSYAFLVNGLGVTLGDLVAGIPNSATQYFFASSYTRATATGTAAILYSNDAGTGTSASTTYSFGIAPGAHYETSCQISSSVGGTYYSVVGRRDFDSAVNTRISNGIVRVTVTSSANLQVEWYRSGAWATTSTYVLTNVTATTNLAFVDATVLKNSPEECVLRLWCTSFAGYAPHTVDVLLKRGQPIAWLYCAGSGIQWALAHSTAIAQTTAATYGMRRTASLNNNYTCMMSDYASTRDLVNGSMTSALRTKCSFGIGASDGTTVGATPDGVDQVGQQFFIATGVSQRVITV